MWKSAVQLIQQIRSSVDSTQKKAEISLERKAFLETLQSRLGYKFADISLLDRALTHKSYIFENASSSQNSSDYESLEFLGDSILDFIISEFLYLTYPGKNEGELSKLRSYLVSTRSLHQLSSKLGLGEFLKLSRGEARSGGRKKKAILADLFESVVAAIYLDGDLDPARDFVLECYRGQFGKVARGELDFLDHKSLLQEYLHSQGLPSPRYRIVGETGPDHEKEFHVVAVYSDGSTGGEGRGYSKKEAEQMAARDAMQRLGPVDPKASSREPE